MMAAAFHRHVSPRRRSGFTLIESALAMVIIGVGVVGMLQLLAAGSMANGEATELTTAVNLANNIHEIMVGLSTFDPVNPTIWSKQRALATYNDVISFNGDTYSPPVDVNRNSIAGMGAWSQSVSVQTVAYSQLTTLETDDATQPAVRVTVSIVHNGRPVYQTSWVFCGVVPP
jgi:prepilin-type N-terminal cleavage/methylation domain-containing protein